MQTASSTPLALCHLWVPLFQNRELEPRILAGESKRLVAAVCPASVLENQKMSTVRDALMVAVANPNQLAGIGGNHPKP